MTLCEIYAGQWGEGFRHIVIDGPGRSYDVNLRSALVILLNEMPDFENIVIMEDDDWYGPNYLAETLTCLKYADAVGVWPHKMYNIRYPSWRIVNPPAMSALAATAFKRSQFDLFFGCLERISARSLDGLFWDMLKRRGVTIGLRDSSQFVSIKGMFGRPGLSYSHGHAIGPVDDWSKLREWIGQDVEYYRNIVGAAECGDVVR